MKNVKMLSGILAVALVFGMMVLPLTGCDNGGDSGGGRNPGTIPNFSPDKNYQPIEKADVDELKSLLTSTLEEQVNQINQQLNEIGLKVVMTHNNRSAFGRAAYNFDDSLVNVLKQISQETGEEIEIPEGLDTNGSRVKLTIDYKSEEDPFPIKVNGSVNIIIKVIEGAYSDLGEDYDVLGTINGGMSINNVVINADETYSGSVTFSIGCGLNIAEKQSGKFAKCILDLSLTSNLNNDSATAKVSMEIYGADPTPLLIESYTFNVSDI